MAQEVKNLPAVQEMQETWVRSLDWEDPLEGGHGNLLQDSCLENPMDRGAWGARVHGVTKNQTRQSTPTQQIKTRFFQFSSFYFCNTMLLSQDFPVAQMVKNLSAAQETWV